MKEEVCSVLLAAYFILKGQQNGAKTGQKGHENGAKTGQKEHKSCKKTQSILHKT